MALARYFHAGGFKACSPARAHNQTHRMAIPTKMAMRVLHLARPRLHVLIHAPCASVNTHAGRLH